VLLHPHIVPPLTQALPLGVVLPPMSVPPPRQLLHWPEVPQAVVVPPVMQVPLWQQKPPEQCPSCCTPGGGCWNAAPHALMQLPPMNAVVPASGLPPPIAWQVGVEPLHLPHAPLEPHAEFPSPSTHTPSEQQPALHGCVAEQLLVHWPRVLSQAIIAGQSALVRHPQLPLTQACPKMLLVQSAHVAPQAFGPNGRQESVNGEQQPPLQLPKPTGLSQNDWQEPLLQEVPLGQSAAVKQPQPFEVHAWPFGLEVQSVQVPLKVPHAVALVPAWQVLELPQQVETQPLPHAVWQRCVVVVSHVVGGNVVGHCAGEVQPQKPPVVPAMHVVPMLLLVQSRQRSPFAPHAVVLLPTTQIGDDVEVSQQPPLHVEPVPQLFEHAPPKHACPTGQSLACVQPQPMPGMHAGVEPAQLWHMTATVPPSPKNAPPAPQAVFAVPGWHLPLTESQQPSEHGELALHEVVHLPPLQALPLGQSDAPWQPH
jgi:hypothetical protein